VWLPDAMAGPTPVSALIHAATMVTGGVYLVARLNGVYLHAEAASQAIVVVGAATAFFAATIAIAQNDIKKVLAYSTLSQLGFMFVALGVGAYGVAIFHVTTHAFFKACLFLGSGSVIHAMQGEQDIHKMGALGKKIPITFLTFGIATLAIAGIPPLSGFFSKDEILWFAFASTRGGSTLLWLVMATTALITAFYMTRLFWLTFLGDSRVEPDVEHHIHESPPSMSYVLIVLAVLSAVGGFIAIPHWLEPVMPMPEARHELHHLENALIYVSVAIAVVGISIAAYFYGNNAARAKAIRPRLEGIHRVLAGKYFVDEFYQRFLGDPLTWISDRVFLRFGDRFLIDGALNGMAAIAQRCAGVLGRFQSGSLQRYVLLVLAGSVACILWSVGNV
jgi:NADH-quinone oxidoreductase subunit L